jgi:hypothetical protein
MLTGSEPFQTGLQQKIQPTDKRTSTENAKQTGFRPTLTQQHLLEYPSCSHLLLTWASCLGCKHTLTFMKISRHVASRNLLILN